MAFAIVSGLVLLALIPFGASRGWSIRMAYLAWGLIGLVFGAGCVVVTPTDADLMLALNSNDEATALGFNFLHAHGPALGTLWTAIGVGGLLGALIYQKKARMGRPPLPEGEKAVPITIRIAPDVLEKLRHQAEETGIGYQTLINQILERAAE